MSIDTRQHTGSRSQRSAAQRARVSSEATPIGHTSVHATTTTPTEMIRAGVVETTAGQDLVLERLTPNVLRVAVDGRVLGFVEHVGRVNVALAGARYDRAVEVAQTLDVASAARALA